MLSKKMCTTIISLMFVVMAIMFPVSTAITGAGRRLTSEQRHQHQRSLSEQYSTMIRSSPSQRPSTTSIQTEISPSFEQYITHRDELVHDTFSVTRVKKPKQTSLRDKYNARWAQLAPQTRSALQTKQQSIIDDYSSGRHPWLDFNQQDFSRYVLNGPRPYWLWITFTAVDGSMHCPNCKAQHVFFEQVAPLIQQETLTEFTNGQTSIGSLPLIMAVVQPSHARALWRAMNLQRAPVSTLLPPSFDPKQKLEAGDVISAGVLRQTMMINPTMEDITSPLETNGWPVTLAPPPPPNVLTIIFAFCFIGVIAYVGYLFYPQLLQLRRHYPVLMLLSLVIYFFAVSGGGWLARNNPPSTSVINGQEIWIARESSQQLGAEICTMFIIQMMLFVGWIAIILPARPLGLHNGSLRLTLPAESAFEQGKLSILQDMRQSGLALLQNIARFILQHVHPRVLILTGYVLVFFGYVILINVFKIKMPSYPFSIF